MTVDARNIIGSLIDGCGMYVVANVLGYAAGLRSPASDIRISGLVESTGFVRVIFPLAWSINIPPIIAAVYVAAFGFLILEAGLVRHALRLLCLMAAIIVLVGSGTRTPMALAVVLPIAVTLFPFVTRWIAQGATILAASSALILPSLTTSIQFAIAPLISLVPGRINQGGSIGSLNNRDYVWSQSIKYWTEWINDLPHIIFGFGVNGQYRSGASLTYSHRFSLLVRHPEHVYVHNSFLQQLFDGGLLGLLLMTIAVFWASSRLSKRRHDWGHRGLIAIVAMTVLLLSGMTEVALPPGPSQDGFWLLMILVGVACQATEGESNRTSSKHRGRDVAAARNAPRNVRSAGVRQSTHC